MFNYIIMCLAVPFISIVLSLGWLTDYLTGDDWPSLYPFGSVHNLFVIYKATVHSISQHLKSILPLVIRFIDIFIEFDAFGDNNTPQPLLVLLLLLQSTRLFKYPSIEYVSSKHI